MDILKAAAVGVIAALLATLFRKDRAEYAMLLSIGAGVLLLGWSLTYLRNIVRELTVLSEMAGLSSSTMKVLLKVVATGYITQFAAELCRDAGSASIAAKIEMGGKLIIVSLSLPIFTAVLELMTELI
jgi:stage III sporulation protein AD